MGPCPAGAGLGPISVGQYTLVARGLPNPDRSKERERLIRRRLDAEMVRRRLATSMQAAQHLIDDGQVLVDGASANKAARLVDPAQAVELVPGAPSHVSRGGPKLAAALDEFGLDPGGRHCLDAGSSTGGFTDCLLQRGAASVVAVDVGTNQLHERLRSDPRVIVREQTDVRELDVSSLPNPVDLVVADLSFISLRLVLAPLADTIAGRGPIVALVKPQFEANRREASKGRGVIHDPHIWRRVLGEVVDAAAELGLSLRAATVSPITGAAGNIEFVVQLAAGAPTVAAGAELLDDVVTRAEARRS